MIQIEKGKDRLKNRNVRANQLEKRKGMLRERKKGGDVTIRFSGFLKNLSMPNAADARGSEKMQPSFATVTRNR